MALSKRYQALRGKVDPTKVYPMQEALTMVKTNATAKFNESIDVSINLGIDASKSDQTVRGSVVLPQGTGKTVRIAVFGVSQGGDTALAIAAEGGRAPNGAAFHAAAAFYPPCADRNGAELKLPTLIVVGRADSVTPAADCETLAALQPPGRVSLAVVANAAHGFDLPEFGAGRSVLPARRRSIASSAAICGVEVPQQPPMRLSPSSAT